VRTALIHLKIKKALKAKIPPLIVGIIWEKKVLKMNLAEEMAAIAMAASYNDVIIKIKSAAEEKCTHISFYACDIDDYAKTCLFRDGFKLENHKNFYNEDIILVKWSEDESNHQ
jgi:hypothetical protein